jgi:EAL domain-containing protein (putative c-di-GMP-specific phosphodiesterase class I)
MAKQRGRNTYTYFQASLNTQAEKRLQLESELRKALDRNELTLHYQPIVNISSGAVEGAEALLRWKNPKLGSVPPDQFIPLAEETGLIIPIGDWVLQTACREAKTWQRDGRPPLRLAVNISSRQFRGNGEDLVQTVERMLEESGLQAGNLELEVTENLLMEDITETVTQFQRLNAMGVNLSIDDFGTGYSALSYLKRFPFDLLKIDREFVRNIISDPEDAALTTAIITMAQSLGLKVIAEGIETEQQLAFLREKRCDLAQGYFFSKPVPAEAFRQLLAERPKFTAS